MSTLLHVDPNGTQRIRVYCSRKALRLPCIQEYFRLDGLTPGQQKKAWKDAHKRDKELADEFTVDVYKEPWNVKDRAMQGNYSGNYFIKVRGISLSIPGLRNDRGAIIPDWGRNGKHYFFDTYPPRLAVSIFKGRIGKQERKKVKTFSFRSNRQLKSAWVEAVDFYLDEKPQYESYRDEMLESCPKFSDLKQELAIRFERYFGERPWA